MTHDNLRELTGGDSPGGRAATPFQPVPGERTMLETLLRRQALALRRGRSLLVLRQLELQRALNRSGR